MTHWIHICCPVVRSAVKLPYREMIVMYHTCVEVLILCNVSVILKTVISVWVCCCFSVSSCFVFLFQSVGKGSLWCVCPEYRPALLEVLRKTHSYHSTDSNLINKPALWVESHGLNVCSNSKNDFLFHLFLLMFNSINFPKPPSVQLIIIQYWLNKSK